MIETPGSITIAKWEHTRKYQWKSSKRTSFYKVKHKKAFVRITASDFIKRLNKLSMSKRQVKVKFIKKSKVWQIKINRVKRGLALQPNGTRGKHPYLSIVLNKVLPKSLWEEFKLSNRNSYTVPVRVLFNLEEWRDVKLEPRDFLTLVEKDAKDLMKFAIENGFNINFVPKGRSYDLELIGPRGNKFILAISFVSGKNESRSKEAITRKVLMDIAKILTVPYIKQRIPVIISQPIEFEKSWSYTTNNYLDFYKNEFDFNFLNTNYKKGWEKDITNQLLELDNKLYKSLQNTNS